MASQNAAMVADLENVELAFPDQPDVETFASFDHVKAVRETPSALLVVDDRGEQWIPKKAIAPTSAVRAPGDVGTLDVLFWFARKKWWVR